MAISIDWGTRVITIPQADLTPLGGTLYELNVNTFRLALKDLEDDPAGMSFPDTHKHNTEIVIGGITYARSVEIINGYTVTFEDGQYRVNLVGANNNIADVLNLNQVSVVPSNSGGLIVRTPFFNQNDRDKLTEFWQLHGLDIANALNVSGTARTAGAITQSISQDAQGKVTVKRQ